MRRGVLRLALAQLPLVVGNPLRAAEHVLDACRDAESQGADLLVTPELYISGYPADDLLLQDAYLAECDMALQEICEQTARMRLVVLVGSPLRGMNAAVSIHHGRIRGHVAKHKLPSYGPFDEARYFRPGTEPGLFEIDGEPIGVTICEDIWVPGGPHHQLGEAGCGLVINLSASPYHRGKLEERSTLLRSRARDWAHGIAYVNMVGAHDELVFDGASMLITPGGETAARAAQFTPGLIVCDVPVRRWAERRERDPRLRQATGPLVALTPAASLRSLPGAAPGLPAPAVSAALDEREEIWSALTLALTDYTRRCGFERVVFGMSGGIDSALVALLAADALGPDRVDCLVMPSPHSAEASQQDARDLARELGIACETLDIEKLMGETSRLLDPHFAARGRPGRDVTEENIQARLRAVLLLAHSNKLGAMLIATSNKTEAAVGYSTYMGDSAGGMSLIRSIGKLLVYELVAWRTAQPGLTPAAQEILERIVQRPPSAELSDDQRDEDTLPPYEILDPIVEAYVEDRLDADQIVMLGHDPQVVTRILGMIDRSEFKRRQAPPGPKITRCDWGRDRRMPISRD